MTLCPLLLTFLIAIITVIVLFSVALHPQAKGLETAGLEAWLSWLLAVMLVLVEIFLVTLVYNLVVMSYYQDKIFKKVLIQRGFKELVEDQDRHAGCARTCRSCCRVSLWLRLVLLIITLPLHLLPILGSILYASLNGTIVAWEYHLLYFELKNFSYGQQRDFVDKYKVQYSSFGMQALLLEMIPGLGLLFVFTNAVGAALFAAQLESKECEENHMQEDQIQSSWNSAANNTHAYNNIYVAPGGIV
ncbi:unnamed protein product [Peronospora belbahrii]|uniref:Uncharacterized protein n=1 Tax=Peronospora belbahrii TaxID=622444 RepID=A0ABN8D8V6_9STRA|nr:unnamed protein product [Peronospora belbahrii]